MDVLVLVFQRDCFYDKLPMVFIIIVLQFFAPLCFAGRDQMEPIASCYASIRPRTMALKSRV